MCFKFGKGMFYEKLNYFTILLQFVRYSVKFFEDETPGILKCIRAKHQTKEYITGNIEKR